LFNSLSVYEESLDNIHHESILPYLSELRLLMSLAPSGRQSVGRPGRLEELLQPHQSTSEHDSSSAAKSRELSAESHQFGVNLAHFDWKSA